jgi:uncharacterized protein YjdB
MTPTLCAIIVLFLVAIEVGQIIIYRRLRTMPTKQQLLDAVDALTTTTANDLTEITRLLTDIKNQPNGIQPADLQPVLDGINSVNTTLAAAGDQIKSAADQLEAGAKPALTVSISPTSATVPVGGSQSFSATVSDGSAPTYSVSPTDLGTVDQTGAFVAGAAAGTGAVIATASDGSSASASVTVTA